VAWDNETETAFLDLKSRLISQPNRSWKYEMLFIASQYRCAPY